MQTPTAFITPFSQVFHRRPPPPSISHPRYTFRSPRAVAVSPDTGSAQQPQSPNFLANYRITIISSTLSPGLEKAIEALVQSFSGYVVAWRQLSDRASEALVALPHTTRISALRQLLYTEGRSQDADFVLQEDAVVREAKRLAVFDLDSTLIAQETIDELAAQMQLETQVAAITERAMNGEIGFREALAERVALLKGLPLSALDGVKDRVVFTPGAARMIRVLSKMGCRTAVVSGGFHFLADHVRDVLGLDYCYANRLQDEGGVLTGRTVGEVVDAEYKERTLVRLAEEMGLRREQVLAVGDGSNDLLMMGRAGTGVAFNAKPVVQEAANVRVNQRLLSDVLYLLGLAEDEIENLCK